MPFTTNTPAPLPQPAPSMPSMRSSSEAQLSRSTPGCVPSSPKGYHPKSLAAMGGFPARARRAEAVLNLDAQSRALFRSPLLGFGVKLIVDSNRDSHRSKHANRESKFQRRGLLGGNTRMAVEVRDTRDLDGALLPRCGPFRGRAQARVRPSSRQGVKRYNMRGKGIVSRTCSSPQIHATTRSMPMPKPACGTVP